MYAILGLGLDRTGHMSFLTGQQDGTPKFAGQVLPDRTESGLIFLKHFTYQSVKSPVSGKEIVQFLDSPDLENLPDFRTGHDVR